MSFVSRHKFYLHWSQLTIDLQRAIKINFLLQCYYARSNQDLMGKLYWDMVFNQSITLLYKQIFVDKYDSQGNVSETSLVDYFGFSDFEQEISSCDRFRVLNLSQLGLTDQMWLLVETIVAKISSLEILILSRNRLKNFRFSHVPGNLFYIDLRANPLESVEISTDSQDLNVAVDNRSVLSGSGCCSCMQMLFDAFAQFWKSR